MTVYWAINFSAPLRRRWEAAPDSSALGREMTDASCRFANRCPSAMPTCIRARPPLYQTAPDRAAACYLYDDAPPLATGDVNQVFANVAAD